MISKIKLWCLLVHLPVTNETQYVVDANFSSIPLTYVQGGKSQNLSMRL